MLKPYDMGLQVSYGWAQIEKQQYRKGAFNSPSQDFLGAFTVLIIEYTYLYVT